MKLLPMFAFPYEWDKSRSYEGMLIVGHEGKEYTAIKDVPAGIDIEDEEYWLFNRTVSY